MSDHHETALHMLTNSSLLKQGPCHYNHRWATTSANHTFVAAVAAPPLALSMYLKNVLEILSLLSTNRSSPLFCIDSDSMSLPDDDDERELDEVLSVKAANKGRGCSAVLHTLPA